MSTEVRHNTERSRYELLDGDEVVAVADYRPGGDGVLVFPHTEVAHHARGQGHGATLVRAALDDVRERGMRVVPSCWYVADFIRDNPSYRDLLAS